MGTASVYCIGGSSEKANIEVVETLCGILDGERPRSDGASYESQITYLKDRLAHDRCYAINASKLSTELGWKPSDTFEPGLRKTVRWYLGHQDRVADVTSGGYRDWIAKHSGDGTVAVHADRAGGGKALLARRRKAHRQ